MRTTKIIATVGESIDSVENLSRAMVAGADIFRQTLSHESPESVMKQMARIRCAARISKKKIEVLHDLPGAKPRIGAISPRKLEVGEKIIFSTDSAAGKIQVSDMDLAIPFISPGERIFVCDGMVQFLIEEVNGNDILCEVMAAKEILKSCRGMNFPDTQTDFPSLTEADKENLKRFSGKGVDYFALSFVKNAGDVIEARKLLSNEKARIISKIECREALKNIDEIIDESDGIIIARGDLALETSFITLPQNQTMIIEKAKEAKKFSVVATQLLESMVENPIPLRSEVIDIANVAYQGADAVMLSAETACGKHPFEALRTVADVLEAAEADITLNPHRKASLRPAVQ
ncbi:MAG: pyruvate kinase [Candidatus Aenigmatarchaeota archaeon]